MVIDSSAVIALLLGEAEAGDIAKALAGASTRMMSSFSLLESSLVVESRKGEVGGRELDLLIHRARIEIVPFDSEQSEVARIAWRAFGKGRHPASLNIGDCCSYALAKISGEPLLCKGNDFPKTDLALCLPRM
jgi:ribonuclease VapC